MSGVVIGVGAAIGAVVGGGSSIYGMNKQNRSAIKAFKKQMEYLQINYNYNQAALDRQERSMYDNALGELFAMSLNAYQNNAQIEAAIAETGLEGRSQEKIEQVIHGQSARQETATKEAYMMGVWDVRAQKDALYIQTKASVEQAKDNLDNNLMYGSKAFQQFMGSAIQGAAIGAATAGIASAAGGALAGGAASATPAATAPALSSTSASIVGGMESSLSLSATSVAATETAGAGAAGAANSLGMQSALTLSSSTGAGSTVGTALQQGSKVVASTAPSTTGGSFMSRMVANYQKYKPYVDFVNQFADYYNQNTPRRQRGGYFY